MSDTIYSYYNVSVPEELAYHLKLAKRPAWGKKFSGNLNGVIGLQINRPPRNTKGRQVYNISYSFCSPLDNFSKKETHRYCNVRSKNDHSVVIYSDTPLKAGEISQKAIDLIIGKQMVDSNNGSIRIPDWVSMNSQQAITPRYRIKQRKAA